VLAAVFVVGFLTGRATKDMPVPAAMHATHCPPVVATYIRENSAEPGTVEILKAKLRGHGYAEGTDRWLVKWRTATPFGGKTILTHAFEVKGGKVVQSYNWDWPEQFD
jgi:hypothetical protein